ncbi:MAG: hypothetical protein LC687_01480 [Actinobacteria bacterium]|nr:hypothetical protein [Actinomycetota bacterium]
MTKQLRYNTKQTTYGGLTAYWTYVAPLFTDHLEVDVGEVSLGGNAKGDVYIKLAAKPQPFYEIASVGEVSLGSYAKGIVTNKFAAKLEILHKPALVGAATVKNSPGDVHIRTTR